MNPAEERRPGHNEAIEAEAAAWLAQRDDGLSPEDEANFARWRGANVQHEAAVRRLEVTWRMLQSLQNFRPEAQKHPDRDLLAPPSRKKISRFSLLLYTAPAASLLILLAVIFWPRRPVASERTGTSSYVTAVGGFQRVALPDGSVMELNAITEARSDFSGVERRVYLLNGEASFSVAKNKTRPFVVSAGAITVRAVGTAFDVRFADQGTINVLVTEGVVKLAKTKPASLSLQVGAELATIEAGQHAIITGTGTPAVRVEDVTPEAIRVAIDWRNPRMVFVDTPLAEVLKEFNRQNRVKIELGDSELGELPVGGTFQSENVEAFVRLITANGDLIAERPAPDRIVLRKSK